MTNLRYQQSSRARLARYPENRAVRLIAYQQRAVRAAATPDHAFRAFPDPEIAG